jgi:hypothetical protein
VLAPTIVRLFGNTDLPNRINPGHSLADKHFSLTQLGDNLFGLVSLDSHNLILRLLTIPVDQFSGGGSQFLFLPVCYLIGVHIKLLSKFRQRLIPLQYSKGYPGLKTGGMISTLSSHLLLLSYRL